jgi:hypothetical protein
MGFLHVGQIGGGVFFGMVLALDQARVFNSLSPITAETGAVMAKSYRQENGVVCPEPDSKKNKRGHS